ncbi:unnamed protein product [Phaeothamnion confervicola]
MPFLRKCGLVSMLGFFFVFGLSACEREYWPQRTWVTNAAENGSKRLPDGTLRYEKPFDTWVDNPKLAEAIRDEIQETGRERLIDRYEFECKPRPAADSCADCLSCTAIFWQWELSKSSFIKPGFVHRGDARVSVEFGPGTAVSAMTYWTK